MDRNKKYLFQLTEQDIAELAATANVQPGEGIVLNFNEKGLEISIDKQALRMWVNAIMNGQDI